MPDRTAKDIMIPLAEYASVSPEDSLHQAIIILKENLPRSHRSLAVLEKGRLIGFLTTRTILKSLEVYGFEEGSWDRINWGNFFTRKEKDRLKNINVRKIMRPAFDVYLDDDTPLQEVTRVLLRKQVNHIPVRDKEGNLVGIIRTIDVLDVLADLLV